MKKLFVLFLFAPLCAAQAAPAAGNVTRYTLMLAGNKAGYETVTRNADGSLDLCYEFNDRGRGPRITEHLVLDKNGLPVELHNSGNDYLKATIDEHFSVKNGIASWKNRAEQGEQKLTGKAFYVSISGAPEEGAILAKAALGNGGRPSLLPSGGAAIEDRHDAQ